MSNIVRAWGLTLVVCGIMQVCMWFLFLKLIEMYLCGTCVRVRVFEYFRVCVNLCECMKDYSEKVKKLLIQNHSHAIQ